MAVDLRRVATAALIAALKEDQPTRRDGVSGARAVAAGFVLGTVARVAVRRGARLGRQTMPQPLSRRQGETVDRQPSDAERGQSFGAAPEADETSDLELAARPDSDDAMTRSEEELRIRTVRRERGRLRLRKYIVTEEVQRTIPLRREEIRIEQEPQSGESGDPGTADAEVVYDENDAEEHEIVLYEEVPVIEKRVVPRERVRIVRETRREEAEIVGEVRRERIEAEGDIER